MTEENNLFLTPFALMDKIKDGITVSDEKGQFEAFNLRMNEITGYTVREAENCRNFSNLLRPSSRRNESSLKISDILIAPSLKEIETRIHTKNGFDKTVLISTSPIRLKNSPMFLSVWHDITERKMSEEALKRAQEELEAKVERRTSDLLELNLRMNEEISERKEREKITQARNLILKLLMKSTSKAKYLDTLVNLIQGWSGCHCVGLRLLSEKSGNIFDAYTGFSDEFLKSEREISLKKSQYACVRIFTSNLLPIDVKAISKMGFVHIDDISNSGRADQKDRTGFRKLCREHGFKSMALIPLRYKKDIIGIIHLADKKRDRFEASTLNFMEMLTPLISEGIYKFTLTDEINRSHQLLEKVFSGSNLLIAYLDTDFNYIRVNRAYAETARRRLDSFPGENHFRIFPDPENKEIFIEVVRTGRPFSAFAKPFSYFNSKESTNYWDITLHPVKNISGKVEGLILFMMDVTQRKNAEEELLKTQQKLSHNRQLSDIGTLAATVAHELRNPLAAIQMAAYNTKRKMQNTLLEKHLLTIEKKVEESNQIINNLLFYSRIKPPQCESVKLGEIITECILAVKNRHKKERIHIVRDLKALRGSGSDIEADPHQIREVFLNVLNNAFEAMSNMDGIIEVRADRVDHSVKISIIDSGPGIDEENIKNVFDAFFTTKTKGTGLGLTVCKQIMNLHGGRIEIASQKNKKTQVSLLFPIRRGADA